MLPQINDRNSNITPDRAIDIMVELHRETGKLVSTLSKSNKCIELTVLILTVLTSSGLWILISLSLPKIAAWAGAIISTIIMFLTLYKLIFNVSAKVKKALSLYGDIGSYIANIRSNIDFNYRSFWDKYKYFEVKHLEINKLTD